MKVSKEIGEFINTIEDKAGKAFDENVRVSFSQTLQLKMFGGILPAYNNVGRAEKEKYKKDAAIKEATELYKQGKLSHKGLTGYYDQYIDAEEKLKSTKNNSGWAGLAGLAVLGVVIASFFVPPIAGILGLAAAKLGLSGMAATAVNGVAIAGGGALLDGVSRSASHILTGGDTGIKNRADAQKNADRYENIFQTIQQDKQSLKIKPSNLLTRKTNSIPQRRAMRLSSGRGNSVPTPSYQRHAPVNNQEHVRGY